MAHACSKTFLSLLNSLLILFGIALIILSFSVYNKYHSIQFIISIIMLAFSILFIGLLGLVGALKQSKYALSIYIILIGFITLILLILLIIFCTKQNWLTNKIINNYMMNSELFDNERNINITYDFLIKLQCCGFKERNEPKKIFNQIDFCNNITQTKPICDEQMKNDFYQNLFSIISIFAILTGLGALACILAIHLACTSSNKTRPTTFQRRYH